MDILNIICSSIVLSIVGLTAGGAIMLAMARRRNATQDGESGFADAFSQAWQDLFDWSFSTQKEWRNVGILLGTLLGLVIGGLGAYFFPGLAYVPTVLLGATLLGVLGYALYEKAVLRALAFIERLSAMKVSFKLESGDKVGQS